MSSLSFGSYTVAQLRRYGTSRRGTVGRMELDEQVYDSIECPWRSNRPFVSCIPPGLYLLRPWWRTGVVAIVGGSVGLSAPGPQDTWKRWACLVHSARSADQLQGCIALGVAGGTDCLQEGSSEKAVDKFVSRCQRLWAKQCDVLLHISWDYDAGGAL